MSHRRGMFYATGALLISGPPLLWVMSSVPVSPRGVVVAPVTRSYDQPSEDSITDESPVVIARATDKAASPIAATAKHASGPADRSAALGDLARRDPMELVHQGKVWYQQHVRGYRCTLVKQELLGDKLSEVQEIELRYREQPRAVYMIWRLNADQARRALYLDSREYVDKKGNKLARVEPNGAVARLFTKDIFLPVDGAEARKASRRIITEAGFATTFDLFETYNATAEQRGVLDLKYDGTGAVDGRPTFVVVRHLPYEGPTGPYPDARLVMHIDQEWLLPVAVYSYADRAEKKLLGSYVFTKIELNPAFDGDDFAF
ncbi:MAG: DUF1571 domain-containing protein [Planctomycetota bacterium]